MKAHEILTKKKVCRNFGPQHAQMEIIGLTFIVLLVVLGILFLIIFSDQTQNTTATIEDQTIANNFVSTYLNTVVPLCSNNRLQDLIKDCSLGATLKCGSRDSCTEGSKVTQELINATLGSWKRAYDFKVIGTPRLSQFSATNGCAGNIESSKEYVLQAATGLTIKISLKLCEKQR